MRHPSIIMAALGSSFAFFLFAGCSGNGSQSTTLPGQPTRSLAVGQSMPFSAARQSGSATNANKRITTCPQERVYVANYLVGDIEIYPKDWATSPTPCATLTHDTLGPGGISVDKNGTLYVSNFCCKAISVFPRDARSPSRMIITAGAPNYAYVGADGTVYSSETVSNQVEEFAPGATSATRTISVPNCYGVATDSKNNLYVVSDDDANPSQITGHVRKFKPGSTIGTDLGLTMHGAAGIVVTKNDSLVVGVTGGSQIDVFPPGATVPSRSFKTISPFAVTLSRRETKLYVASSQYAVGVAEYDFQSGTQLGTITAGLYEPDGVAYDPPAPY